MSTIAFTSPDELRKKLRELGVKIVEKSLEER